MVSGVSLCTCALFSRVAPLRLVHSVDILHTEFIDLTRRVSVKSNFK